MSSIELPATEREFEFGERDFRRVCALIYQRAGIALSDSKRELVYGRLARRLRALRCDSFGAYLARLEDEASPEWEAFTNALTTNLTAFFRENHHFEMLAEHLHAQTGKGALRIWSSAASTGEEPYSIAITVAQAMRRASDDVRILATDIDTNVLAVGERGVYPLERLEALPGAVRQRFFLRGTGHNEGLARVSPALRAMVSFRRLNLLAPAWPMRQRFDVVFCRNVLIYFDKETQRALLRRMAEHIHPGGLLFIGHSESFNTERELFESIGRTAYRRVGKAEP